LHAEQFTKRPARIVVRRLLGSSGLQYWWSSKASAFANTAGHAITKLPAAKLRVVGSFFRLFLFFRVADFSPSFFFSFFTGSVIVIADSRAKSPLSASAALATTPPAASRAAHPQGST